MFIPKNYIMLNELQSKMKTSNNSLSVLLAYYENSDQDIKKLGNTTYIYKYSKFLPDYVKDIIRKNEFTDVTTFLPLGFFKKEITTYRLKKFGKITRIAKKEVLVFNDKFKKIFNNYIVMQLPIKECKELKEKDYIIDYESLTKTIALAWY